MPILAALVFLIQRMLRNAQRMPAHYRDAQREWLRLAQENSLQ
jgi:hypothetical protein